MALTRENRAASSKAKEAIKVGGPFLFGSTIGLIFTTPSPRLEDALTEVIIYGLAGAVGWGAYDRIKKKSALESIMGMTAYGTGVFAGASTAHLYPPIIDMIKNYF